MNKKFTITLLGTVVTCTLCATSAFAADGKVTGNSVRMREKANTKATIVETINKDATVDVLSEENNWYKVSYKNKEGYIYKDYIEVDKQANSEKTTQDQEESNKDESSKIGNILNSDSKLYLTACYSSSNIGEIKKNTKIKIEKTISNWSYISSNDLYGWVPNYKLIKISDTAKVEKKEDTTANTKKAEVIKINKKGYLSVGPANLRKGPGINYNAIGGVAENEKFTVLEEDSGWYKVKTADKTEGYLLKTLVVIQDKKTTSRSSEARQVVAIKPEETKKSKTTTKKKKETKKADKTTNSTTNNKEDNLSDKRKDLVKYAKKYLGYKYVHGGSSPKEGFDCSGYTKYVFGKFGYKLSRSSSGQADNGKHVDKKDLKLGDLLIFTGHVGIYIGNNEFIHASNPSDGVKITSLSNSYYVKHYKEARRIIK